MKEDVVAGALCCEGAEEGTRGSGVLISEEAQAGEESLWKPRYLLPLLGDQRFGLVLRGVLN